jgi:hypothetical protein
MRWTRRCRCCCGPTVRSRWAGIPAGPYWSVHRVIWRGRDPRMPAIRWPRGVHPGARSLSAIRWPRGVHPGARSLSDLLVESLRCSGARIAHSSQPHATISRAATDLVVLADYLVADPHMLRDLHSQGVPHLTVRVRDGTGLVGPLVIPGVTSCLGNS